MIFLNPLKNHLEHPSFSSQLLCLIIFTLLIFKNLLFNHRHLSCLLDWQILKQSPLSLHQDIAFCISWHFLAPILSNILLSLYFKFQFYDFVKFRIFKNFIFSDLCNHWKWGSNLVIYVVLEFGIKLTQYPKSCYYWVNSKKQTINQYYILYIIMM